MNENATREIAYVFSRDAYQPEVFAQGDAGTVSTRIVLEDAEEVPTLAVSVHGTGEAVEDVYRRTSFLLGRDDHTEIEFQRDAALSERYRGARFQTDRTTQGSALQFSVYGSLTLGEGTLEMVEIF